MKTPMPLFHIVKIKDRFAGRMHFYHDENRFHILASEENSWDGLMKAVLHRP